MTRPKTPVPGLDLSGRVVAVGADVSRFRVGDRVFYELPTAMADLEEGRARGRWVVIVRETEETDAR